MILVLCSCSGDMCYIVVIIHCDGNKLLENEEKVMKCKVVYASIQLIAVNGAALLEIRLLWPSVVQVHCNDVQYAVRTRYINLGYTVNCSLYSIELYDDTSGFTRICICLAFLYTLIFRLWLPSRCL